MLIRARAVAKRQRSGVAFTLRRDLTTRLKAALPWELTGDQQRALREITGDMTAPDRMHRLLMGDVGTGKTVVALFAMLLAVENDFQAALMAPTELLAEQHAATLDAPAGAARRSGPSCCSAGSRASEKAAVRARLAAGQARLVVGTHALMQESVSFRRLGLVVIDEQHRFGVEQRAALIGKGAAPDVLLLTATPIPRSLALTLYGDLDVSTLRERPPGRGSVRTAVRGGGAAGPGARVRADGVRRRPPGLRGAAGHRGIGAGRPPGGHHHGRERWPPAGPTCASRWCTGGSSRRSATTVMRRFRAGEIHVLVATTVIEVGNRRAQRHRSW